MQQALAIQIADIEDGTALDFGSFQPDTDARHGAKPSSKRNIWRNFATADRKQREHQAFNFKSSRAANSLAWASRSREAPVVDRVSRYDLSRRENRLRKIDKVPASRRQDRSTISSGALDSPESRNARALSGWCGSRRSRCPAIELSPYKYARRQTSNPVLIKSF
jgi:hypothetical protein